MGNCTSKKNINEKSKDLILSHNKFGESTISEKCLIVDDSETNRMILSRYIRRKNILCDEAINGKDALEKIDKNGKYKIVFMDIQMPLMNGIQCTKELKLNGYDAVIIGTSGFVDEMTINECKQAGMDFFINKPIDREELYLYLDKYVIEN